MTDKLISPFEGNQNFEEAQRMGKALAASDMVPDHFKGNLANTLIAMEIANRMKMSVFGVMNELYIVHGTPGWSAKFMIACINKSSAIQGLLKYDMSSEGDERTCIAWARDDQGDRIEGPPVSIGLAKRSGWYDKKGPALWKTNPELMLRYRAATYFGRLYCPEQQMGLLTVEEINDIQPERNITGEASHVDTTSATEALKQTLQAAQESAGAHEEENTDETIGSEIDASTEAANGKQAPKKSLIHRAEQADDLATLDDVLREAEELNDADYAQLVHDAVDKRGKALVGES